jgi:hypothetical protein
MTDRVAPDAPVAPTGGRRRRRWWLTLLAGAGIGVFVAFWVWALFFASKEPVNRIDDRAWARRAQQICAAADAERVALIGSKQLDGEPADVVRGYADLVDSATDIVEQMLDDVVAVPPTDAKGLDLIPQWEADYRTLIADRRAYAADLRRTGENLAFYETEVLGLPITERLETFAGDNHMPDCGPPRDLSR